MRDASHSGSELPDALAPEYGGFSSGARSSRAARKAVRDAMSGRLGVAVIMVVYHTGKVLYKTVAGVLAQPAVDELILVDNGSGPQLSAYLSDLAEAEPRVRLIQGHGNIGFGRAVNLGARLTHQPYLLVLNPDAFLRPGCVEKLVAAHRACTRPAIIGARLLNEDLTEQRGSRRGEVTPVTTMVSLLRLEKRLSRLEGFELHLHEKPLPDRPVRVPTISGACFLISRQDFRALNGFDPHFFLHVEDIDLCWRIRQAGGDVIFHPEAEVIHVGHTSLVTPVFVERHKAAGLAYFFRKRARGPWRHLYIWTLTPLIFGIQHLRAMMRKPHPERDDEV